MTSSSDRHAVALHPDQTIQYFESIAQFDLLGPIEELELARRYQAGGEGSIDARDKLIESNLKLAASVALKFSGVTSIETMDLVESANLGLFKAIDDFDPDIGFRFSTFARLPILKSVLTTIADTGSGMRIPRDSIAQSMRIRAVEAEQLALSGAVSDEDILEEFELSPQELAKIRRIGTITKTRSLDFQMEDSEGNGTTVKDSVEDPVAEVAYHNVDIQEVTSQLLDVLDDRQRIIVTRRYGLDGLNPREISSIAQDDDIHLTRMQTHRIEKAARDKMLATAEKFGINIANLFM